MNRVVPLAGILLVLAGGWLFFWNSAPGEYRNLPPANTGPWVCFGDSLTEGYGAVRGKDYPSLFAQKLGTKVVNLGVSGNTTADGLARIDSAIKLKPRVVMLCLGGNDTLQQIPREQTFANLATMIDRFHRSGSFVVLVGVRSASILRDKNAEHFENLAKEKNVFYIPNILDGVFGQPALMSDKIHPNGDGYEKIAHRLEEELKPIQGLLLLSPSAVSKP
ncbi:MAG: arylesterase [Verrucomicrobiales bacterium]|nr:arylesterase [Verrucomicrobiales bacterium]|tara:strand:- start:218 stop:877 length:660 start_codon:yes stop_codon:yes gene_type:complete